jgi:hypothetical protein
MVPALCSWRRRACGCIKRFSCKVVGGAINRIYPQGCSMPKPCIYNIADFVDEFTAACWVQLTAWSPF